MSECSQLKDHYEAYALGALEGQDRVELEAHLARGCPTCAAEMERARWLVAQLAYLAPQATPPASLRHNLLDAARQPAKTAEPLPRPSPRAWSPVWAWAAAAALLLFSLWTIERSRELQEDLQALEARTRQQREQSRKLEAELRQYQQVSAILSAPGTREISLAPAGPGSAERPGVRAFWNQQLGLVLSARQVPAPPAHRAFQLWVVPKDGKPIGAGVFRPDESGRVLTVFMPPATLAGAAALAITEEPAAGSSQPTTSPLWVGKV